MENASKALLIAGGILIGIILLSLGAYLFSSAANFGMTYREEEAKQQIEAFNAKFEIYSGIQSLSIHDVITAANLANQNNTHNEYNTGNTGYISVFLDTILIDLEDQAEVIQRNIAKEYDGTVRIKLYECTYIGYYENGRIKEIKFKETDPQYCREFYADTE